MAAGFEVAKDTRGDANILGQGIGTIVSKVLAAKVLARKEREYAERKADEQGIDIASFNAMFGRGYFFKKALVGEMGGNALKKKKQELAQAYRKTLLIGKITKNPRLRKKVLRQLEDSAFYSKGKQKEFRKQFDYTDYEEYLGEDEAVPSTAKKTKSAVEGGGRGKRVSREQIAESISKMADSINRAAQAISQSSASVYGTLITANSLQADVANDLKLRNDTLENKLQSLIDAISNQTTEQKNYVDKTEDKASEASLEKKEVAAAAAVADDLRTDEDESREYSTIESEQIDGARQPKSAEQQRDELRERWMQERPPQAESGGVFSGPDSGYLVELHGNEAVIPIDNNYTQGEPSAIDGKVRPKPQSSVFNESISNTVSKINNQERQETSTTNFSNQQSQETSITPRFSKTDMFEGGTEISMSSNMDGGDAAQPITDVMSLPFTAVGGGLIAANRQVLDSMGPDAARIAPKVNQMSRTIASVYGVPDSLAKSVESSSAPETGTVEKKEDVKEDKGGLQKMLESLKGSFGKFLEMLGMKINDAAPDPRTPAPPGALAKDLGSFIGEIESGNDYTKMVGGAKDASVLGKTVDELHTEKGGQFAMGRYQIQMRTAKGILAQNNIDSSKFKFDKAGQDQLFQMLLEGRGLSDFLAGKITEDEFLMNLSMEWAALPKNAGGLSYYDKDGKNKSHTTYEKSIEQLRMLKSGVTPPNSPMPDLEPSTDSSTRLSNAEQISQRARQQRTSVVTLNSSGDTQQPPSAGAADTPGEASQIRRGLNPLDNSGIYVG